jgi:heat-inducible transcriptional repressor
MRSEVDTALRTTTEMLSQVTSLVALVTAPPLETTEIRHIEVLLLQPQVVMVVVITSTGGVTKKIIAFDEVVDPGLAEWAREFLNDQLTGVMLGGRMLQNRLAEPGLSPREQAFLEALRPAFSELVWSGEQGLYVGGAGRLLDEMRFADLHQINDLVHVLESRVGMLAMLREALDSQRPYLRIGSDHTVPYMRGLAMVAANYGLATRNLGTVSLIGPMRMDYAAAIRSVRGAARTLSEWVAEIYEE